MDLVRVVAAKELRIQKEPLRRDVQGFVMAPNGSVDFEGVYR